MDEPCQEVRLFTVDQTYARTGGSGTGITRYRAVETVDGNGIRNNKETRLVYMNGLERPISLRLSAPALARIPEWGPYTQSFDRVIPLLQPSRLRGVRYNLLRRSLALIQGSVGSRDTAVRLLSRPATPARATYLSWLPPLPRTDTKCYMDMYKIVRWLVQFCGAKPAVLGVLGDGQTVLRMRDSKRKHPSVYKHVLVMNGGFHSHAPWDPSDEGAFRNIANPTEAARRRREKRVVVDPRGESGGWPSGRCRSGRGTRVYEARCRGGTGVRRG